MLQQGHMCVNDYFKKLESVMIRVGLDESNEENFSRFAGVITYIFTYSCVFTVMNKSTFS